MPFNVEGFMPILPGARRAARKPVAALAVVAAVLVAVGCSSNSSSSSSAASSATASSSSTSASASASASATSGGSGLSAADQAGLAKAQAFLATAETRPTQITNTVKITKAIPKGKTIDFITCGATPECTQEGQLVQDAATLLGWSTVILNNDGSSAQWKSDFDQVVRTKPAAVLFTGIPAALYASDAAALKANGTFVSTCCVTDEAGPSTGIGYAIDTPNQVGPIGGAQAALVAADSKDTADSLIVNLPDLPILDNGVTDYKAGMATYCPTCQVSELDIALANIATAPATISAVAASRRGVMRSLSTSAETMVANTIAVSRNAATSATGAIVIAQSASPYEVIMPPAAAVPTSMRPRR